MLQPIDPAQSFVLSRSPPRRPTEPCADRRAGHLQGGPGGAQNKWATTYANAVTKVTFVAGVPVVPPANDGPVPVMMASELSLARSGALDADLLAQRPFYGTDFTRPLLFLEDGQYYSNLAADRPDRRSVGRDERDRQLSRPAVALAVHSSGIRSPA